MEYNQLPDIKTIIEDCDITTPVLRSPNSAFELPFYQTKDSLINIEDYKKFLDNSVSRFRHSRTYKNYKSYLISLGLDHCQIHNNINNEMATVEMHHNVLTIYDIAIIISEHMINTVGYISTFDLVQLLKYEHTHNYIQVVMLSLTPHQLYHANSDFYIHPNMCFGNWYAFLQRYRAGINRDIAYKILYYLKRAEEINFSDDKELLNIRNNILDWSYQNEALFGR